MKHYLEVLADKILPKFNQKCGENKCKHPKCECGHCSRNYHIGRDGRCTKINQDLTTCNCKRFNLK